MPDYFTTVTAEQELKGVSKDTALALARALGLGRKKELPLSPRGTFYTYTHDESAYTIEWAEDNGGELYIFAEENACTSQVPEKFWKELAKLLTAKKMPYLEFGWASHCSKPCVGSYGVGEFRLYNDGQVVYAKLVYPKRKSNA